MKKKNIIFLVLTVLYFLLLAVIIIVADLGLLPAKILDKIPHYDLIGHFVLYGIASILLYESTSRKSINIFKIPVAISVLILIGVTIIEEISQLFFSNRTFSILDLTLGILGIIIFLLVYLFIFKNINKKRIKEDI